MSGDGHEYIELSNYGDNGFESTSRKTKPLQDANFTEPQLRLILLRLGLLSDDDYHRGKPSEQVSITRQADYMIDKIDSLSIDEAISILRNSLVEFYGDVNYLQEDYRLIERLIKMIPGDFEQKIDRSDKDNKNEVQLEDVPALDSTDINLLKNRSYLSIVDWNLQVRLEAALIHFHSPYPEVRSITDPYDDVTILSDTFRAYFIGFFWTFVGSIINNFFVHRMPQISLGSHTIQILLLPCGKLWERYVPNKVVSLGPYSVELNPGPWTYKEMMLSSIIYSCSAGTPYSVYNIFVMKLDKFYGLKWVTFTFQVLLATSTQFLGFGFALLMKKVCVYPSKALWPTVLPTIALNRALMKEGSSNNKIHGWKISPYSFFYLVFIGSFIYNWIPSYFFQALSRFNWTTWFNPESIHLTNITGSNQGLGLNPWPTFDWNIIDSSGCLTIPFYTYANQYLGSVIALVVILIVYYTNNKWTGYFPINSNKLFNNKGHVYDVHDLLDENNLFDDKKYQVAGPPYFGAAMLVSYGANFLMYPFAILYHFVMEWDSMKTSFANIWLTLKESFSKSEHSNQFGRYSDDPHCKMMAKYEDVPDWWFLMILIVSTLFAVICVTFYPTETPIWGIFFTIGINFIFLVPLASIASVTGFSFGLNVLVELIVGYAIPNSGIALITLKGYGYNIDSQASNYITDQKLAHYSKIPPKAIFKGQLISTFISMFVALVIANWQLDNVPGICEINQKDKLSCPGANTYFYSSVQYGEIGPAKVFGGIYPALKWCFLGGVLLVAPCVWFKRNGPKKLTRFFQPTIIIGGFLTYAPYNLSYLTVGLYFSYTFMYYIKEHYLLWWEKYNYVLTSALSAGVAFSALVMFFTVQYNPHQLNWWGNTISDLGLEGRANGTWLQASSAPEGYVGLRKGHYP